MTDHYLLFRASLAEEEELVIARKHFWCMESRAELAHDHRDIDPACVVIPRYAALPFYKELEDDVLLLNGKLINTYREHQYVADLQNWYGDLEKLTPLTWFRLGDALASQHEGPFVLKGATNSKKHAWKTHMLAETRNDIMQTACHLMDDTFISQQQIYVREFEVFESFVLGVMGLPITNEWRFFVLDGKVMAYGFYWSEHVDWLEAEGVDFEELRAGAHDFVRDEVIPVVKDKIRFWVVDIGRREEDHQWRVIKLNDGQMSGLSCVDPDELYANMATYLEGK